MTRCEHASRKDRGESKLGAGLWDCSLSRVGALLKASERAQPLAYDGGGRADDPDDTEVVLPLGEEQPIVHAFHDEYLLEAAQ